VIVLQDLCDDISRSIFVDGTVNVNDARFVVGVVVEVVVERFFLVIICHYAPVVG
jgi:hypothetical protein